MDYREIALFTDLDGTLFNSNREVSAENIAAINEFLSNKNIETILKELKL